MKPLTENIRSALEELSEGKPWLSSSNMSEFRGNEPYAEFLRTGINLGLDRTLTDNNVVLEPEIQKSIMQLSRDGIIYNGPLYRVRPGVYVPGSINESGVPIKKVTLDEAVSLNFPDLLSTIVQYVLSVDPDLNISINHSYVFEQRIERMGVSQIQRKYVFYKSDCALGDFIHGLVGQGFELKIPLKMNERFLDH